MRVVFRSGLLLSLIALVSIANGCGQSSVAPVANNVPAKAAPATADAPFPLPIVELRGSGDEIGTLHGQALASPIQLLFRNYLQPYFHNDAERIFAMASASMFESHVLPEHQAEVKSLARAAGLNERETMLGQCFLDLAPPMGCSTITLPASASPDGVARFGRNLDFFSFDIADKHTVVLIYHPTGRYGFAAVGWPGMIGVLSGMNENGLTLANMEVHRLSRPATAMPYTLLYRAILEQCKTVDEAIEMLNNTPRQTANNLMLMDAAGNRAVVEITPESVVVRRGVEDQALISTNHQRGQDQSSAGQCWRYDKLCRMSVKDWGNIDETAMEKMLSRTMQGDLTLQSMVFEPSRRIIRLATGSKAANQPFYQLDLHQYFP